MSTLSNEILWIEFCFKWSYSCWKSSIAVCHNLVSPNSSAAPRSHLFVRNKLFKWNILHLYLPEKFWLIISWRKKSKIMRLYLKFFELISGLKYFSVWFYLDVKEGDRTCFVAFLFFLFLLISKLALKILYLLVCLRVSL